MPLNVQLFHPRFIADDSSRRDSRSTFTGSQPQLILICANRGRWDGIEAFLVCLWKSDENKWSVRHVSLKWEGAGGVGNHVRFYHRVMVPEFRWLPAF